MSEFITAHNLTGIITGIATFLIIGLFHPLVIKAEYYIGVRCWWLFLLAGLLFAALSLLISDVFFSTIAGVIAFSCFWSIAEVFQQRRRVEKGWFPANPKRQKEK
jgi:hypothetical protein